MLELLVAWLMSAAFAGGTGETYCVADPPTPSVELVYRLREDGGAMEPAQAEVEGIICRRLQALRVRGQVTPRGETEIGVALSETDAGRAERLAADLGARGQLLFYDWEPNLIGPERRIGAHPGRLPPTGVLRAAEREWRLAGRKPNRFENHQLLIAGAFPTLYGAVRLASEQPPRTRCAACAARGPLFYMFDRTPPHRLIAGPAGSRADLRAAVVGEPRSESGLVLRVPLGTAILYEHPFNELGRVRRDVAPGWFALRDRPALTGADIVDPAQEFDETTNAPNVTFAFTPEGRIAFQRVTKAIARRGQAAARGPVTMEQAEALSGHFAVTLDGKVATRPIINFAENPDGIDGRTGAQISGGFTSVREARELAATLRIGALPVELELVRLDHRG